MVRNDTVLRVFVSSPGDVFAEREALEIIIREINTIFSQTLGIRFELFKWETDVIPGIGTDAQSVINESISDDYDIFIGIFWGRFGTPTKRSESGTSEEFERAFEKYTKDPNSIKILMYLKEGSIPFRDIDPGQLGKVTEFRDKINEKGVLYKTFNNTDEFANLARVHLSKIIQEFDKKKTKQMKSVIENKGINDNSNNLAKEDIITKQNITQEDEKGIIELIDDFESNIYGNIDIVKDITKALYEIGDKTK